MLRTLAFAAVIGVALAGCPNLCSGHGKCSGNDKCTCFANWQGPDCSLRTCAFGNAWALDAADPHGYEECSGAGLCDRSSGECKCFSGFTGYACQRSECPNDCSGHGLCRSLVEIKSAVPYSADKWDADQLQACVCDAGFFGTDCSQRRCPTGDDPLTTCIDEKAKNSIQEIKVSLGSEVLATNLEGGSQDNKIVTIADGTYATTSEEMDVYGTDGSVRATTLLATDTFAQFKVGAVDATGQTYYAPTSWKGAFTPEKANANGADVGAANLELALENIPMGKVRDVKVDAEYTTNTEAGGLANILQKRYMVTFIPDEKNSANVGLQNPLVCESGYGCSSAGCAPIVKMPFLYRYAATTLDRTTIDADGTTGPYQAAFYTGDVNTDANFQAKKFIRLHSDSMPRMPIGQSVDTGANGGDKRRYDIRVVVAVQGSNAVTSKPPVPGGDVYYTKVTYGHSSIVADATEWDNTQSANKGVFGNTAKMADYWGTLRGFTYRGFIPDKVNGVIKASIPDAPGIILEFPDQDMITASDTYKFYEILIKLPACEVTPVAAKPDGTLNLSGVDAEALTKVDPYLENIECSNRGQCNRESGMCECYEGYFGVACHRQTVLV